MPDFQGQSFSMTQELFRNGFDTTKMDSINYYYSEFDTITLFCGIFNEFNHFISLLEMLLPQFGQPHPLV